MLIVISRISWTFVFGCLSFPALLLIMPVHTRADESVIDLARSSNQVLHTSTRPGNAYYHLTGVAKVSQVHNHKCK
ncbi:hypothetical protein SCLCIDRAFT_926501 [Scleroderma citrinum Foug A]|uniref:Uncharacterized protein n=1 Tax=Scleroderma citrinum Foug A TaxID=1036808 RepID=A0A0C3DYI2_9AGAM|nr:hypothetical protein SCLCIDRAFT_926501 [Scleroderma citrinum Foug A]